MRLAEELRNALGAFLAQRERGVLLLTGAHEHLAYAYQILVDMEASSSDVFLPFPHEFVSAADYAEVVVERVRASYREARPLDTKRPVPGLDTAPDQPPWKRIREALQVARNLVPVSEKRIVAILCPLRVAVAAQSQFDDLACSLASRGAEFAPWFHGMRILLHLPGGDAIEQMRRQRHVQVLPVDFSPEAIQRSLEEEADDASTPAAQRAQASMQVAFLDYAHGRLAEARHRFLDLLSFAQGAGNPLLEGMVMIGLGDVESRAERLEEAQLWYERGLLPATALGSPMLLLVLSKNLGHLYFLLRRYAESEQFFDGAQTLAKVSLDLESRLVALEWRGLAQLAQGDRHAAATSLLEALGLVEESGKIEHHDRIAEELRRVDLADAPMPLRESARTRLVANSRDSCP